MKKLGKQALETKVQLKLNELNCGRKPYREIDNI